MITASIWSSEMNTWSSLVHFLVMVWRWVGVPRGGAKSKPKPATALISISALLRADLVNSLVSVGSSQCGWCWLKLPSQRIGLLFSSFCPWRMMYAWVNASSWWIMSFILQSLYILNSQFTPVSFELDNCHVS
jgi:hypothetical protein